MTISWRRLGRWLARSYGVGRHGEGDSGQVKVGRVPGDQLGIHRSVRARAGYGARGRPAAGVGGGTLALADERLEVEVGLG